VPVNTKSHTTVHKLQLVFEIEAEDISTLLRPLEGGTCVHIQFDSKDFPQNRKPKQEKFLNIFATCTHGKRRYKSSLKAGCVYLKGQNSLKRFQLQKFYFKNFVISIFLVHFVVLYVSVNSYLFSPVPQATGLEHSPVPILVIIERGWGGISCHSRTKHYHFYPQKTLQDLLVH